MVNKWVTKLAAKAFKKRWKIVNVAERKELRASPIAEKCEQLVSLMTSVEKFGWDEALGKEETGSIL